MNVVLKNRRGMVRSGWIIALCLLAYNALIYSLTDWAGAALGAAADAANLDAASYAAFVEWMNGPEMYLAIQYLNEAVLLVVPLAAWRLMRYRWQDIGLRDFRTRLKKDGVAGLVLGSALCTAIFLLLLATGNMVVEGLNSPLSLPLLAWALLFVFVGVAEEVMYRGFIMSVLRRTNSKVLAIAVPSLMFGALHLTNPNLTPLSVVNVMLIGVAFSVMYYKSGNLWMCIGCHIAWNLFQSVVYGMPASGVDVPSIVVGGYPVGNLLNGGAFGIEGGVLATVAALLALAYALFRYRASRYRFFEEAGKEG